jgi:hypothetical protein
MSVLLTRETMVQVVHQGFARGHPWRVLVNGELIARERTYADGIVALVAYLEENPNER